MGFINLADKTISAKLVYYGVGMGGKTTSLKAVHEIFCPSNEVQLVSINTEEDSTLLFDFLPINLGQVEGFKIRIQGFTVPGQPKYRLMRKYVLSGADAVVLVVDSECSRLEENLASLDSMQKNLRLNGLDPDTIPLVLQYNKRDLKDTLSEEELDEHFKYRPDLASFPTVATEAQGVFEAFVHAAGLLVESKVQLYGLDKDGADAQRVAEGARRKLWEIYDRVRGRSDAEVAPSTKLTVTDDQVLADADAAEPAAVEEAPAEPKRDKPKKGKKGRKGGRRKPKKAAPEPEPEPEPAAGGDDLVYELRDHSARSTRPAPEPGADDAPITKEPLKTEIGRKDAGAGIADAGRNGGRIAPGIEKEVFSDQDLDVELGTADDVEPELAEAAPEDIDEKLLDKSVQSNLELARRFGELDQFRALLERKNQELVEIAQNTVHDLNRPLSAIKLMLSTMAKGYLGDLPEAAGQALDNGLFAVQQMERLIGDLMDSSRLDHDGVKLNFADVDMTLLVADVLRTLRFEIDEYDVRTRVEPLPIITGDEWALSKVFMNLLGNAIQYAHPERTPVIRVWAEEQPEEERWVFYVRDNGIGVPAEDRDRLFRRFERGSNSTGISGTGLGLHIIREVAMGHGGNVWLESREGEGTCFMVALPFQPVQPPHSTVSTVAEQADG